MAAPSSRPGYSRHVYNIFLVSGDADDCADFLEKQGLRPDVYERSVRAEGKRFTVHVVVGDQRIP